MTYEDITGIGESLGRIADALEALLANNVERVELLKQSNAHTAASIEVERKKVASLDAYAEQANAIKAEIGGSASANRELAAAIREAQADEVAG